MAGLPMLPLSMHSFQSQATGQQLPQLGHQPSTTLTFGHAQQSSSAAGFAVMGPDGDMQLASILAQDWGAMGMQGVPAALQPQQLLSQRHQLAALGLNHASSMAMMPAHAIPFLQSTPDTTLLGASGGVGALGQHQAVIAAGTGSLAQSAAGLGLAGRNLVESRASCKGGTSGAVLANPSVRGQQQLLAGPASTTGPVIGADTGGSASAGVRGEQEQALQAGSHWYTDHARAGMAGSFAGVGLDLMQRLPGAASSASGTDICSTGMQAGRAPPSAVVPSPLIAQSTWGEASCGVGSSGLGVPSTAAWQQGAAGDTAALHTGPQGQFQDQVQGHLLGQVQGMWQVVAQGMARAHQGLGTVQQGLGAGVYQLPRGLPAHSATGPMYTQGHGCADLASDGSSSTLYRSADIMVGVLLYLRTWLYVLACSSNAGPIIVVLLYSIIVMVTAGSTAELLCCLCLLLPALEVISSCIVLNQSTGSKA